MRITLDIDEDVLQAAKELAAREKKPAGQVISDLARRGIHAPAADLRRAKPAGVKIRNGVPVFPARGEVITLEHVQKLMDEEGI